MTRVYGWYTRGTHDCLHQGCVGAVAAGIFAARTPAAIVIGGMHHVEDFCTRSDSGNLLGQAITIPITLNIGRDVQAGEAFGPWFRHEITWTCMRTAVPNNEHAFRPPDDRFEVKTDILPLNTVDQGAFPADPNFRVYGYPGYNIGLIAKVTQGIAGGPEQTTYVNTVPGGYITTTFEDGFARQHGDISRFHLTLEVRLVKLKGLKIPESFLLMPIIVNFFSISRHPGALPYWKHNSHYYNYLKTTISNVNAACTTPNIDVPLGDAHGGNLRNADDTGPTKEFNLRFENCPAYMRSVAYRFQSASVSPHAISNGTLPLDPVSTASGVGVQVLHADDTPLAFSTTFIPLADYDPQNPSPVYLVPMKARIIRTDGELKGGSVHAAMKMVVRYR